MCECICCYLTIVSAAMLCAATRDDFIVSVVCLLSTCYSRRRFIRQIVILFRRINLKCFQCKRISLVTMSVWPICRSNADPFNRAMVQFRQFFTHSQIIRHSFGFRTCDNLLKFIHPFASTYVFVSWCPILETRPFVRRQNVRFDGRRISLSA